LLVALVVSCGYTVGTRVDGPTDPRDFPRKVAIQPFQNRIEVLQRRPGVELRLHQAVLDRAILSGYRPYPPDSAEPRAASKYRAEAVP
jgi:hypothetical protein